MIRQIKQKQSLKNKIKMLSFWKKHTLPPLHCIVEVNCLEQHKETVGGNLYYIDDKCKALISPFGVIGNCPTLPTITEKKQSKEVEIFLIDHDIHQSLCELLNFG